LYAIWINDVAMIGTASLVRDDNTGPFTKSIFFCMIGYTLFNTFTISPIYIV